MKLTSFSETQVSHIESEFNVQLPPILRNFLLKMGECDFDKSKDPYILELFVKGEPFLLGVDFLCNRYTIEDSFEPDEQEYYPNILYIGESHTQEKFATYTSGKYKERIFFYQSDANLESIYVAPNIDVFMSMLKTYDELKDSYDLDYYAL